MAENNCPFHAQHETRIVLLEKKYDDVDEQITKMDKDSAVEMTKMTAALEGLAAIPAALKEVTVTLGTMQVEIAKSSGHMARLETQVTELKSTVTSMDDDRHFNIMQWIKRNWVLVCAVFALAAYAVSDVIKSLPK